MKMCSRERQGKERGEREVELFGLYTQKHDCHLKQEEFTFFLNNAITTYRLHTYLSSFITGVGRFCRGTAICLCIAELLSSHSAVSDICNGDATGK